MSERNNDEVLSTAGPKSAVFKSADHGPTKMNALTNSAVSDVAVDGHIRDGRIRQCIHFCRAVIGRLEDRRLGTSGAQNLVIVSFRHFSASAAYGLDRFRTHYRRVGTARTESPDLRAHGFGGRLSGKRPDLESESPRLLAHARRHRATKTREQNVGRLTIRMHAAVVHILAARLVDGIEPRLEHDDRNRQHCNRSERRQNRQQAATANGHIEATALGAFPRQFDQDITNFTRIRSPW